MSYNNEIGRIGEQLVAEYLCHKGNIIVAQNYHSKFGEIDIIAENKEELIFVEVKTRKENSLMAPADVVDAQKQIKITKTSAEFLRKLHWTGKFRFDIAEVTYKKDKSDNNVFSLNYIKNAFKSDIINYRQNL